MMLTTVSTMFKRDKKRAPSIVAECSPGRSGTLRTTREGNSPAESGIPGSVSGIHSDTETGSPITRSQRLLMSSQNLESSDDTLNNRGARSPERGRVGWGSSPHTLPFNWVNCVVSFATIPWLLPVSKRRLPDSTVRVTHRRVTLRDTWPALPGDSRQNRISSHDEYTTVLPIILT